MLDCSASQPRPPVTPPIARPGNADAAIKLVISGTTPLRALSRGVFAVTAAALPLGGTFTWHLKGDDAAKLEDAHKSPQGIFTMPRSGPARAQASEQTLVPLKPGHVEITVDYTINGKKATQSVTMDILPPLLFLHGIASNAETWNVVKDHLTKQGLIFGGRLCATCAPARQGDFYTADFSHPQDSYIRQSGEVAAYVGQISALIPAASKTEGKRVILVAHSMGGLAARGYLQDHSYRGDVAALITIGTPHQGSVAAQFIHPALDEDTKAMNPGKTLLLRFVKNFGVVDPDSEGARELAGSSDDMRLLNKDAPRLLPRSIRYVSVIGVMPHDVAQKIKTDTYLEVFGPIKVPVYKSIDYLEKFDQGWQYFSHIIERTDGLVDEGSQNLNTLVKGLGAKVFHTEAIHCCWPSYRAPAINETEQTDVIITALGATGLVGGLAR